MVVSSFTEEKKHVVATNTIIIWSGLLSNIPAGWVLCDGANGTPDLRDRFAKGVSTASTNPGGTGGQTSYTISSSQMASHSHGGSTDSVGSHSHPLGYNNGWEFYYNGNDNEIQASNTDTVYTTYAGNHSHTMTTGNTGSGGSVNNTPAYYEVAYIMKS